MNNARSIRVGKHDQNTLFCTEPYKGLERSDNPAYPVFISIYDTMQSRFWIPKTLDQSTDALNFRTMDPSLKQIFTANLSWQILADSYQYDNLTPILQYVNNIELRACIVNQMAEEQNHSASYQYVVSSMYNNPKEMLDKIEQDKALMARADATVFLNPPDDATDTMDERICRVLALEALSFTTSFLVTVLVNSISENAIPTSTLQIKKIAADEAGHVGLYLNIAKIMRMKPKLLRTILEEVIQAEMVYVDYINTFGPHFFLRDEVANLLHVKANTLLSAIGAEEGFFPVKPEGSTLLGWLNQKLSINDTKVAQQAADSGAYAKGLLLNDWQSNPNF